MITRKPVHIYLDMDGVCCDFTGHLKNTFNQSFPINKVPEEDFVSIRKKIFDDIDEIQDFFLEIPPFEGVKNFWNFLIESFPLVTICTAIPHHHEENSSLAENVKRCKIKWVENYLHVTQTEKMIVTKATLKHTFISDQSKYTSVLIDDAEENIKRWEDAGGIGILHTSFEDSIDQLKKKNLL